MIFSLDVRQARKGDCLLLHTGTKKSPGLVMIDGISARIARNICGPASIRSGQRASSTSRIRLSSIC